MTYNFFIRSVHFSTSTFLPERRRLLCINEYVYFDASQNDSFQADRRDWNRLSRPSITGRYNQAFKGFTVTQGEIFFRNLQIFNTQFIIDGKGKWQLRPHNKLIPDDVLKEYSTKTLEETEEFLKERNEERPEVNR